MPLFDQDSLPLEQRERIDAACDRFEVEWRGGRRPRAEDFLRDAPQEVQPGLLAELLRMELEYRRAAGETPSPEQYRSRFPQHAGMIESLFLHEDNTVNDRVRPDETVPTVPGFSIQGVLGRGGMGIVYKARQEQLKRVVALKMIVSGEYATASERARFVAEAEAAARVQHPNVVQVFEVGEHDGRPYLAMEYVEGTTLARRLRDGPLTARDAAACLRTLALAVQAAHEKGVVHRDLKPANVLLSGERRGVSPPVLDAANRRADAAPLPKITDFGLARRLDDVGDTRTGQVVGSPPYMAPEQAAGQAKDAGPACDVYALGVILYECLTGRPPFQAATVLETLDLVRHSEPVSPRALQPGVPRDLETICLKCLEKDPTRRYPSAQVLAERLGLFLDSRPIPDRAYGRLERAWRWGKRHPVESALIAVACLAVLLGGAWGWREAARARAERYGSHVEAARALARRGDWSRAEELYRAALPYADAEAAALELERQRLLLPLGRLDEVTATSDLLRAEVALAEGKTAEARSLFQDALQKQTLDKADEAYARGLLAVKPAEAAAELEAALAIDPDHYRASAVLAQVHVVTGEKAKADAQIRYHQRKFAEDPAGTFLEAWQRVRLGDADVTKLLQRMKLSEEARKRAEQFLLAESEMQKAFEAMAQESRHAAAMGVLQRLTGAKGLQVLAVLAQARQKQWGGAVRQLLSASSRWPDDWQVALLVTRLPWMEERQNALRAALREAAAGQPDKAAEELTKTLDRFPEAMLFYARSNFRSMQAVAHLRKNPRDIGGIMNLFHESGNDAERTILAPAERLIFRRAAMKDLAILDAFDYHCIDPPHPPELVTRIEQTQRRLLFEMPLTKEEHQRVTRLIATDHFMMRPEWVCPLLREWRSKDPANHEALRLLANWELRGKNYAAAFDLIAEGLKAKKDDPELLKLQTTAREELRKLAN